MDLHQWSLALAAGVMGLGDSEEEERARAVKIGDAGAAVLGAALQAMPNIQRRFAGLDISEMNLTAVGVASLAPALRRWPRMKLIVSGNPLGGAGVVALATSLPPTLEWLNVGGTQCDDDGFVALAAALPALTHLKRLNCATNTTADERGLVALVEALPSLPALEDFYAKHTPLGPQAVAALNIVVPQCPRLEWVHISTALRGVPWNGPAGPTALQPLKDWLSAGNRPLEVRVTPSLPPPWEWGLTTFLTRFVASETNPNEEPWDEGEDEEEDD